MEPGGAARGAGWLRGPGAAGLEAGNSSVGGVPWELLAGAGAAVAVNLQTTECMGQKGLLQIPSRWSRAKSSQGNSLSTLFGLQEMYTFSYFL